VQINIGILGTNPWSLLAEVSEAIHVQDVGKEHYASLSFVLTA